MVVRNWALLHQEIPLLVKMHDYFTCPDCGRLCTWDDPEVRCWLCRKVMISGDPGSCPICGSQRCVQALDGLLPCGHDAAEEMAVVGGVVWCAECDLGWEVEVDPMGDVDLDSMHDWRPVEATYVYEDE